MGGTNLVCIPFTQGCSRSNCTDGSSFAEFGSLLHPAWKQWINGYNQRCVKPACRALVYEHKQESHPLIDDDDVTFIPSDRSGGQTGGQQLKADGRGTEKGIKLMIEAERSSLLRKGEHACSLPYIGHTFLFIR